MESDAKWRRKAATFALGEGAPLTAPVVDALCKRLAEDESVYVRAVAAVALGCLYRRSVAAGPATASKDALQAQVIAALVEGLATEESRLDQGLRYPSRSSWNDDTGGPAQDRAFGLKMWRPNDENDVCEGGAITPPTDLVAEKGMPEDRFDLVRSTVRENIGWSLVMVTTHPLPETAGVLSLLVDGLVRPDSHFCHLFIVGLILG